LGLLSATDDEQAIEWDPALTPRIADVLRTYAVGARDFAVLLEQVAQTPHPEVEHLDHVLVDAFQALIRPRTGRPAPDRTERRGAPVAAT
jgi:hypothetical protein